MCQPTFSACANPFPTYANPLPQGKRAAPAAADKPAAKKAKGQLSEDEYAAVVKQYIAKNGPQTLSALGSKISGKPANIKLKTYIKSRTDMFALGSDGTVKLA